MINKASELAREFWEKGRVEDCPILDFHGHMGDFNGAYMPRASTESMLSTMDQANVKLCIFSGHSGLHGVPGGHQDDMDAVRKYPNRFRAYFTPNPNASDFTNAYERFLDNQDVFVGLKVHTLWGITITDDRLTPFYEYADEHSLLVLAHTWGKSAQACGLRDEELIMRKYPKVKFIAGHSFHGDWKEAAKLAMNYPNLYLELTAVLDERGPLEILLEGCGSTRLLFGTDLPWLDTHHGIGVILSTDMSDDDRRNLFYRNGEKLLSRYPWYRTMRQDGK